MKNKIYILFLLLSFNAFAVSKSMQVKGIYYSGEATFAFITCGTDEIWIADADNKEFYKMLDIYNENKVSDFEPMYFEVKGSFVRYPGDLDYVGIFKINKIVKFSNNIDVIQSCVPNFKKIIKHQGMPNASIINNKSQEKKPCQLDFKIERTIDIDILNADSNEVNSPENQ